MLASKTNSDQSDDPLGKFWPSNVNMPFLMAGKRDFERFLPKNRSTSCLWYSSMSQNMFLDVKNYSWTFYNISWHFFAVFHQKYGFFHEKWGKNGHSKRRKTPVFAFYKHMCSYSLLNIIFGWFLILLHAHVLYFQVSNNIWHRNILSWEKIHISDELEARNGAKITSETKKIEKNRFFIFFNFVSHWKENLEIDYPTFQSVQRLF